MRLCPLPRWHFFAVLSVLCLATVLAPATRAANQMPALLHYRFQQGAVFTMRFSLTSIKAIEQPGYADRHYHEVTTGLEQATIAQVFADGAALFHYRFAGLVDAGSASPASLVVDTGGGPPAPLAAARYMITQAVAADGRAEPATQQCSPSAGLDDLAPFTLLPLAPIPYATHPVGIGTTWTAPLPPDDDVVSQAHVQLTGQNGTSGSFKETAIVPIHIVDPKVLGRISGTTVLTASVTQDLVTGVPSSWGLQVTTQVSRTDAPLTPRKPVTLRIQSSQMLSATLVPDAQFAAAGATPIPTPTPLALPTATPVVQALSPAESALAALNLRPADLPACYRVSTSLPVTPRVTNTLFHITASGLRAGHFVTLAWSSLFGGSGAAAVILRFLDVAHAHAFLAQAAKTLPRPQVAPPDLHGLRLGDEQRVGYGAAYGPFDLALRELAYNNRPGEFEVLFRRGPDMVALFLLGDFAPIDLGIYGQRIDQRLQRALAGDAAP